MQDIIKMMYILAETEDTSNISLPLKTTNRIKFLSFGVSENYIVFGASSGGLYVYDRETFTFKALVPSKEGHITGVKISPDEKWFGFSNDRGIGCVLEHSGSSINRRILSHVHEGRNVTALQWDECSSQLYFGDSIGQISVISVASYLTPAVTLMQLDSAIVQLDTCRYMLLVSTMTRSFLCDTLREQYRQIGSRLRDGEFGSCFYHIDSPEPISEPVQDVSSDLTHGPFSSLSDGEWLLTDRNLQNIKLFCARPGLRLWEVRVDGAVISTHQFKQLRHTPPVSVVRPPAVGIPLEANESLQQNHLLQFTKLCNVSNKFLLSYNSNGLYVLDPMSSEVILWTDQFKNVVDIQVVGDVIYLWMGDSRLHAVFLTPIDKFLVCMYLQKKYLYCAQFCAAYFSTLKRVAPISLKLHVLVDLLEKITEECTLDEDIVRKTSELLHEILKTAQNREQAQMLKSGIFVVGNAHLLSQKEAVMSKPLNDFPKKLMTDIADVSNLSSQACQHEDIQSDRDTMNGIFRNSILPSISSLSLISDLSKAHSEEDFDPFPDLPMSSLTSTETIMAFKNFTSSFSGTITNSKKSLKEKWQNFEEKLRRQEESGLSVQKSVNRPDVETSNPFTSYEEDDKTTAVETHKNPLKLSTLPFIGKCHEIENYQTDNRMCLEQLQLDMLDSFVLLYQEFRLACTEGKGQGVLEQNGTEESTRNLENWFSNDDTIPFPFDQYFERQVITTVSNQFQVCLKSGVLTKWISQSLPCTEVDSRLFPSHIISIHNKDSLLIDQIMGRFLAMCSDLLDSRSALQNLEDSGSVCQYFSWNVIVDHFHQNSPTACEAGRERSHSWPLPRTLDAMLVLFQLGQVESCRNIAKSVPCKYVLRTILKLKESFLHKAKLFLLYLEKEDDLKIKLEVPEVYYFTRQAFESLYEAKPDEHCICGYPLRKTKYERTFHRVGRLLLSHIHQNHGLSEAMLLCQKTGVLWHHFLVLRHNQPIEEVLPLILHVACEEELKNRCSEISPPSWDLVFQLRSTLEQGFCLHCNAKFSGKSNSIAWMSLASLMLRETSTSFGLALLSKHAGSIPDGSIHLRFYQNCLLASLAENQSTSLKRNLLDSMACTQELPVLSPKLADRLGLPHSHGAHHWGLQLKLSKTHCLCCLLPLEASGGSVITFKCCHAFHSICLQQRLKNWCPVCVKP